MQSCIHLFCLWREESEGRSFLRSCNHVNAASADFCVVASHLILQRGELFKNVTKFIPLPRTIVPVDLNQATEWLQGEWTTSIYSLFVITTLS